MQWHADGVGDTGSRLDQRSSQILAVLLQSSAPVSGRRIASILGISPTTASTHLKRLLELGLANAKSSGRAVLWSAIEDTKEARDLRAVASSPRTQRQAASSTAIDAASWIPTSSKTPPTLTAVILTALSVEYSAVRSHLETPLSLRRTTSGTRYEVGRIRGEHVVWQVHLAEIGMGNAGAAAEVAGAVEEFSPRLLLFVGVAGGLKPDDQTHGDVVVADLVYNVHSAKLANKAGQSEILSRPLSFSAPHRLNQLVRAVGRENWVDAAPVDEPHEALPDDRPAVYLRPIVGGEVVLADPHSDLRDQIAKRFNDAAAIDMESFGVYESAHRYEVPVLAIRGLSDLVGDKEAAADREWQPRAAKNAAAFAVALMRRAEEADIPTSRASRATAQAESLRELDESDVTSSQEAEAHLARLAPILRPWWLRLARAQASKALDILAEVASKSSSANGWLGRIRHRPPPWLRDDMTGDAWVLVALFADSHESHLAGWAYQEASMRAAQRGETLVASISQLKATLATARQRPREALEAGSNSIRPPTDSTVRVSDPAAEPLARLVQAAVDEDAAGIVAAAPAAATALGSPKLLEPLSVPADSMSAGGHASSLETAASAFRELAESDSGIVEQLRVEVLMLVASAMLQRADVASALLMVRRARELAPAASGPMILWAKARLEQVVGPGAAMDPAINVTAVLTEIEETALTARDRRRDWSGKTAEALAIAGRARAHGGDPRGALRLLLSAPRGQASETEARDSQVCEVAAMAALMAGELNLALELAASISDPVERELLRGNAFSQSQNTADRAIDAFRSALTMIPENQPYQLVRALLGLVSLGVPVTATGAGTVYNEVRSLREMDPEAADLVEAKAALYAGRSRDALRMTRQYPESVAAVEIAADAAMAEGDPDEAIRMLEKAGRMRGDEALRMQAMFLAAQSGRDADARRIAGFLATSVTPEIRRHALQVLLSLASRDANYEEVVQFSRRLIEDEAFEISDPDRRGSVVKYRWALAHAEYELRHVDRARFAIDSPTPLRPSTRSEAMLLLAVLRTSAATASSAHKYGADTANLVDRVLSVAATFPDEEIVAFALTIVMVPPVPTPLPDVLLSRVRQLQEDFFTRFPNTTLLRQIHVSDDDLSELFEELKKTAGPDKQHFAELVNQAWLGLYPEAILAEASQRPYAEVLIKRPLGCHVVYGNDAVVAEAERTAARSALAQQKVVLDTATLVMLATVEARAKQLIAQFSRAILPAACRDDVLETRDSLKLRSTASLGWDVEGQRPSFTDFPPELVEEWADAGMRLGSMLAMLDISPNTDGQQWEWDSSLRTAQREGVALWADDLALRSVARSLQIPAFGTIALVSELQEAGILPALVRDEIVEGYLRGYAVDLPLVDRLLEFAESENWLPRGYPLLMLSRPASWLPQGEGFGRFMTLATAIPDSARTPENSAAWFHAAMTGLTWATPPPARPRVAGALLAWSVANMGGASVFPLLLDAGEHVMATAAPDGDLLLSTISALTEALIEVAKPPEVGRMLSQLIRYLDDARRQRAMKAFLSMPIEHQFSDGD